MMSTDEEPIEVNTEDLRETSRLRDGKKKDPKDNPNAEDPEGDGDDPRHSPAYSITRSGNGWYLICAFIWMVALGSTLVAVGVHYAGHACEYDISTWLIVYGAVMLVTSLFYLQAMSIGDGVIYSIHNVRSAATSAGKCLSSFVMISLQLFSVAWFIVGCVYAYSIDYDNHYCTHGLFLWCFWICTIALSLIGLAILTLCAFLICFVPPEN